MIVAPSGLFYNHITRGPVRVYGVNSLRDNDTTPHFMWVDQLPEPDEMNDIWRHE